MLLKNRIGAGIGSVLEWYDFSLYGFFAPLIAQLYFPSEYKVTGLLKAFSAFAVGFMARPVGALIFGAISDRYGRTVILRITPILITIPTTLFSVLPDYQEIGLLAPLLLFLLRIIQGLCIGGEHANNIVYLCETASPRLTYFTGSLGSCTGSLGIFLASSVCAISYSVFSTNTLYLWGWRVAFAASLLLGVVAYLMRRNISEPFAYNLAKEHNLLSSSPIIESFRHQTKDYLMAFFITFFPATAFYYVFVFLPNMLSQLLNRNSATIFENNSLSLSLRLLVIPLLGFIADKVGGIKIARLACVLFILLSYPLFYGILRYGNYVASFMLIFALLTTLNAATTPGLLMKLLIPKTRCTIFAFIFNICFGIIGGLTPIICLFLINYFDNEVVAVYYLMFAAVVTLVATLFFKDRSHA